MKNVNCAGGIVVNPSGQILIVTNEIGSKTLPKGSMEDGETPIETARREIIEESGLRQIDIHKELGVLVRPGFTAENAITPTVIKHIHIFLVSTEEVDLNPQIEDILHAEWVNPKDVPNMLSRSEEAEFFKQHYQPKKAIKL